MECYLLSAPTYDSPERTLLEPRGCFRVQWINMGMLRDEIVCVLVHTNLIIAHRLTSAKLVRRLTYLVRAQVREAVVCGAHIATHCRSTEFVSSHSLNYK